MIGLGLNINQLVGRNATPGQSPLQQAVIAAWDMQEESGPLLPAKGGIEIPAFNSPGFTASGPASGLVGRSTSSASDSHFSASNAQLPVMSPPNLSGKDSTIRFWVRYAGIDSTQGVLGNAWSGGLGWGSRQNRFFVAQSDNTERRVSFTPSTGVWLRREFVFSHSGSFVAHYTNGTLDGSISWDGTISTEDLFSIGRFGRGGTNVQTLDIALLAVFDRLLTAEEREHDLAPRLFSELGQPSTSSFTSEFTEEFS